MKSFIVEGKAVGKQRPRMGKYSVYTPRATLDYESKVAKAYLEKYKNEEPIDGPCAVKIINYRKIPKNFSKYKTSIALKNEIKPQTTPDLDNVLKSIMDGLNGIAYVDDKMVVECYAYKRYVNFKREKEYTEVFIWEVD